MIRSKCFYLFSFFIVFQTTFLFSGLFSDNVIMISPNKYCKVKDLKPGDCVTALDSTSDKHKFHEQKKNRRKSNS
ncbi:hypothetical protein KAT08_02350 [Candidatus Babeliales bacterium]|nr:hypothetical protein [Candidatus Babeliales bacterium]